MLVALELLTALALSGAPGGGGTNVAAVEIEAVDDADEPNVETRSLRIAASACDRSASSVLALADDELADEAEDDAEDLDENEDAEDAEVAEDVEDEVELESSAARRSLRSVSSTERRLLALEELEVDESEEAEPLAPDTPGGGPGGGPPAPPGPSPSDADVDAPEALSSCARNANTAADRLTALEASTDEVDVLADDALLALEFDWPAAPFWPAMLACNNRRRRFCWLLPETERFIERSPVQIYFSSDMVNE